MYILQPSRPDRGWFVNPFSERNPWWTIILSALPALVAVILIFMDQQITAVIINRKENKLKVELTLFQLTWPLGHVSYCHHFSSVVRPSTFHILIFSSETTGPIATKLWWNGPWMAPFQKKCPVIPTSNQDGRQAKNRKKEG